jgi:two-component system LytT family response regulator
MRILEPMNQKYRAVIVERDPILREELISNFSKDSLCSAVKHCTNAMEGMALVREFMPEILICEIESTGVNGFVLVESIPEKHRPITIFMSDHDRFAARAFEVSAADYLVKPFNKERFFKALERAKIKIERNSTAPIENSRTQRQLTIKSGRSLNFVKYDELDWAEAEGKYVRLHMGKELLVLRMSISALEAELDPVQFVRIHRSTIINIDRVRRVQPWNYRRTYQVVLQDGTLLVLSRKAKLRQLKASTAV